MPDGSEFHTVGAATLKPREAKVVRTRGTDNRLVFAKHRKRENKIKTRFYKNSQITVLLCCSIAVVCFSICITPRKELLFTFVFLLTTINTHLI